MKTFAVGFAFACLLQMPLSAQLVVTPEPSDTNLIFALAGPGILVENPVRTCDSAASGFFDGIGTTIGLPSGVLLSSGSLVDAIGPNDLSGTSTDHFMPGDAQLNALPGIMATTNDACALEFDMTVSSDTLKLNYVFGSEEYLEFVGSSFNDVFAFFLSGPGIPTPVNIALIPGTSDPVAINTVNDVTNSTYFVNNGDGYTAPFDSLDIYVQFDGLTVVLQARYPVTPDSTYHMKLVVADVADGILDSGVFLASGALGSLRLAQDFVADGEGTAVTEGCGNGIATFTRSPITDDTLWLDFAYSGSADAADFAGLPERLAILPGHASADLVLTGLADGSTEGMEELVIDLFNPQSGFVYQTLNIPVQDGATVSFVDAQPFPLTLNVDADVPAGSTVSWDFGDGSVGTGLSTTHDFAAAGVYTICMTASDPSGCDWSSCREVSVGDANGLDQATENQLILSPNPASDRVRLETPNQTGVLHLQVYDATGRLVLDRLTAERQLDLRAFAPGIYHISAEQNGQRSEGRLVVE